jgi:hypothetical protein
MGGWNAGIKGGMGILEDGNGGMAADEAVLIFVCIPFPDVS